MFFEKDSIVLDKDDEIDSFIIVENGMLEFRTIIDGNSFLLHRLP